MRSTIVKVQAEKNANNSRQYLPPLLEAPHLTKRLALPVGMPKLVAAPKFGKLWKRRNSEYYPKERSTEFPVSLDDCLGPSIAKKGRRTRKEIRDASFQELMKKQAKAMEKFPSHEKFAPSITEAPRRPRMKIVNQEFYQISNIAYASQKQRNTFKCHSQWCKYKSNDSSHFLRHLKSCHGPDPTVKPQSYCVTCDSKIDAKTMEEEFQHMLWHAENLMKLKDHIRISDPKEQSWNNPEKKSVETEEEMNCDSEIIISNQEIDSYCDDIELKLMEMFDDAPKSEKIKIISVVILPSVDMLDTNENKVSEANVKSQLKNTQDAYENSILTKDSVIKDQLHSDLLNTLNNTQDGSLIDKTGKIIEIEKNEKKSTISQNEKTKSPLKNEDETLIDKLEMPKDDHPKLNALLVREPPKLFEHNNRQNTKELGSELTDELIANEKSAILDRIFLPRGKIKSLPRVHIIKRKKSLINYEVSASKRMISQLRIKIMQKKNKLK